MRAQGDFIERALKLHLQHAEEPLEALKVMVMDELIKLVETNDDDEHADTPYPLLNCNHDQKSKVPQHFLKPCFQVLNELFAKLKLGDIDGELALQLDLV